MSPSVLVASEEKFKDPDSHSLFVGLNWADQFVAQLGTLRSVRSSAISSVWTSEPSSSEVKVGSIALIFGTRIGTEQHGTMRDRTVSLGRQEVRKRRKPSSGGLPGIARHNLIRFSKPPPSASRPRLHAGRLKDPPLDGQPWCPSGGRLAPHAPAGDHDLPRYIVPGSRIARGGAWHFLLSRWRYAVSLGPNQPVFDTLLPFCLC
jgi:hypothetical protein